MDLKQLLEKQYQEIKNLKAQLSSQKTKNTKQASLIEQLTNALEALKKQYEEMLLAGDAVIASQAKRIKQLEQEKQELLRKIKEYEKNAA
jgi:exonuclease III